MLRKLLVPFMAAATVLGFVNFFALHAAPGPNDDNNHGLCTAYFNGQKNGFNEGDNPAPFQALVDAAEQQTNTNGEDNDGDGVPDEAETAATGGPESDSLSEAENVVMYCDGQISGNTDHGRFTCEVDSNSTEPGDQPSCTTNDAPGNS